MKTLTNLIGKSEKEIIALYLSAIETLVHFGATKAQATELVQKAFNETLGI